MILISSRNNADVHEHNSINDSYALHAHLVEEEKRLAALIAPDLDPITIRRVGHAGIENINERTLLFEY